jgi:uncharacterized lipoprotein YmbA
MKLFIAFVLSGAFLFSCTMPDTRIYSLSLPPMNEMTHAGGTASVNVLLHAPRYLDQPYIAYRISPYELEVSNASRWDASPADMVKQAVRDSLSFSGSFEAVTTSPLTPQGFYRCEISLRRFERFDNGRDSFGEMDFQITFLSPKGEVLYRGSLSREEKLDDRSFASLAKSLSGALSQGVEEAKTGIIKSLP